MGFGRVGGGKKKKKKPTKAKRPKTTHGEKVSKRTGMGDAQKPPLGQTGEKKRKKIERGEKGKKVKTTKHTAQMKGKLENRGKKKS